MKSITSLISKAFISFSLITIAQSALAHHSTIGQISTEITQISGTVKEFQFQNPHSWIQVYVTNDTGEIEEWSVEWGNPNNLLRQGYNPTTFPEGAEIVIRLQQHISGSPLGEFVAAQFSNGTTIGDWQE